MHQRSPACCYTLKKPIEKELQQLEDLGVIEASFIEWTSTIIVPVLKVNNLVRLCGDHIITINPVLHVNQYLLPTLQNLMPTLTQGKLFRRRVGLAKPGLGILLQFSLGLTS